MSEKSKYVVKVMLGIGNNKECCATSEHATLEDAEGMKRLLDMYYAGTCSTKELYDIVIVEKS